MSESSDEDVRDPSHESEVDEISFQNLSLNPPSHEPVDDSNSQSGGTRNTPFYRKLVEAVVQLSEADTWDKAKEEWKFSHHTKDPDGQCLCGKTGLTDRYTFYNTKNCADIVVGSSCVEHFVSDSALATAINNISKLKRDSVSARVSEALVQHAHARGVISTKDRDAYLRFRVKLKFTENQTTYMLSIHNRIIDAFTGEQRQCPTCKKTVFMQISAKGNPYWRCCEKFINNK